MTTNVKLSAGAPAQAPLISQPGKLAVLTAVRAGGEGSSTGTNHNEALIVATQVKAGDINGHTGTNHNQGLRIATQVKAGDKNGNTGVNHNETLSRFSPSR